MYVMKSTLFFLICMTAQFFVASDNRSWKVVFFTGYVERYNQNSPTTHAGFAEVLRTSWEAASPLTPKHGDEAVMAFQVGEQVSFFVTLEDPVVQQKETEKCIEGMQQAQGTLTQWVPERAKAYFFIGKFVEEWKKRNQR